MIFIFIGLFIFFSDPIFKFLKEHDLEKKCALAQEDIKKFYKKRKLNVIIFLVLCAFLPKDMQKYFLMVVYFFYKLPYINLNSRLNELLKALELEFSIWLRMMEVLLEFHTVPISIEKSIASAPKLMQAPLQDLSDNLKLDPSNQELYLGFMSEYESLNIERSMHHLYRYTTVGTNDAKLQLSNMIEDNAKTLETNRQDLFEERLNFYSWFGLLPMVYVSFSFLGIMALVLTHLMKGGWHL